MINITELEPFKILFEKDLNGREISIYKLENVVTCNNTFYPNVFFKSYTNIQPKLYNPSSERVMSLININNNIKLTISQIDYVISFPLFYFVYNTDNYYHFIYDSLPYLISYLELKKKLTNIKLLMNYPNSSKKEFYKFVTEFLELLDISKEDIIIIDENTLYKNLYISSSYTHGHDSNLPPRQEIYDFYQKIVEIAKEKSNIDVSILPKKFYVSRRTWVHGDTSNIGTNYTTRRKLECEDDLVSILEKQNIKEVFTENLSTIEKIIMFNNAELVVGAIGGGLCNVLFGGFNLNLLCLVSPTFLEVNYRFKYCFDKVKCYYFEDTFHTERDFWKKWMRVKSGDIIGEIEEIEDDDLVIAYTDTVVAGWNSEIELKKIKLKKDLCTPLDKGLNSSWNFYIQDLWYKFFSH